MTQSRTTHRHLSRRTLLKSMGVIGAGALLAACAPVAPAQTGASGGESGAPAEKVSIKYQQRSSSAEDFVRKTFGPKFQEETGIDVVIEDIPTGEYFDKVVVLAAANQLG